MKIKVIKDIYMIDHYGIVEIIFMKFIEYYREIMRP